ncbi:MAG: hypothetical protein R3E01_03815 [Pirellulaceae bacterium]|nr:hypothetical protein [Planctomycetales bacterium]
MARSRKLEPDESSEGDFFSRIPGPIRGNAARMSVAVVILVGLALGTHHLWKTYAHRVLESPQHRLTLENLEITPPPDWITSDIRHDVFVGNSLAQYNIEHQELTIQLRQAFRNHPWVRDIGDICKRYGGKVTVDLHYRRPVAVVKVVTESRAGVLPIDGDAVRLPNDDVDLTDPQAVAAAEQRFGSYPRIWIDNTFPIGPPGTPWGDPRVADAVQIITNIGAYWSKLDLFAIDAIDDQTRIGSDSSTTLYRLFTHNNTRILWGHAPGREAPGEPKLPEKLKRLVNWLQSGRQLEAGQMFDLRSAAPVSVAASE